MNLTHVRLALLEILRNKINASFTNDSGSVRIDVEACATFSRTQDICTASRYLDCSLSRFTGGSQTIINTKLISQRREASIRRISLA